MSTYGLPYQLQRRGEEVQHVAANESTHEMGSCRLETTGVGLLVALAASLLLFLPLVLPPLQPPPPLLLLVPVTMLLLLLHLAFLPSDVRGRPSQYRPVAASK